MQTQKSSQRFVAEVEKRWGVAFQPGRNPDLKFMAHLWEPLRQVQHYTMRSENPQSLRLMYPSDVTAAKRCTKMRSQSSGYQMRILAVKRF